MGADNAAQTADRPPADRRPLLAVAKTQDRRFWLGLAFAVAVHAALIIGMTRSSPRQMGERSGRPDGISVVLVDEADLNSKNTFREDGSPASAAPATQHPPTPPAAMPPAPAAPQPPSEAAEPQPKQPSAPAAASLPSRPPEQSPNWAIDKEMLERLAPPRQPAKPSEADSAAKSKQQPQQKPPPQLTMPDIPVAPGGRTAAVMRPPGATRSGENDEFGRGVIRALRQTMPSPAGQLGRVTVRLLLSNNGNLVEVQLIRSAGVPNLDQSVVFAVKQASFPIPPMGSTPVDRTFLVTYIYN